MNDVLITFLSLSVAGTILVVILLLLRPVYKNRLSQKWQYYVWLIVIARLLIPFAPETNLVGSLFSNIGTEVIEPIASNASSHADGDIFLGDGPGTNQPDLAENQFYDPSPISRKAGTTEIIGTIWFVVALILLFRKITAYQSFAKYVRAGCTEVTDIDKLEQLGQIINSQNIKTSVELCSNGLISSPLLIGFWKPCIVLPATDITMTDFRFTVLHELTHYKRMDMFYKWLTQAVICLHWFNPFVYVIGKEINRACELSCDEAVISRLTPKERRGYGDTLLHAIKAGGNYKNSVASVTLWESKKILSERLGAIMAYKKQSKIMVFVSMIFSVVFLCGAAYTGAYASAQDAVADTSLWSSMGRTGQPFTYSQQGYYQGGYIFELGWNLNDKSYSSYADKVELTLTDNATITVSFDETCKNESQNNQVLAALNELIGRLKSQHINSTNPLEKPVVVSVKYIGDSDLVILSEEYYKNNELTGFSAIFSSLDKNIQEEYCIKMVEDEKNAFLSATARSMEADMIDFCLKMAYEKENTALFAGIVPCLTDEQREAWIARASRDNKNTFLAVLTK